MTSPDNLELTNLLSPRLATVDVLGAVLKKRQTLDVAFNVASSVTSKSSRDRAFIGFLVRTTLRRLGQIDALIDACLERPLPKKADAVQNILRIGVAQLFFSATAPHAAISTSVDLCRAVDHANFAKLVNAVMRRLQREGERVIATQDAARLNTPGWLWARWCATYGESVAHNIAEQHLAVPPLDITAKSNHGEWAERLSGTLVLDKTIRLDDPQDVTSLEGYDGGDWWVQDAAARLPISALGNVEGKKVYDLCAAPGGKTMELAASGANVTALDISLKRLARLEENLQRTRLNAKIVHSDVREWDADGPAEIVVLDAPCSSTGTLRRHPDVMWNKSQSDVAKLIPVQDSLLRSAAELTAPGGLLLYVTCSLQPEEGPDRIEAFLEQQLSFKRTPILPENIGMLEQAINANGELRTLPSNLSDIGGMDGFFAALLCRDET